MTDPPIVADIALLVARRFRVPLVVISQDVFPEIAVQLKRLENPVGRCACSAGSSASTCGAPTAIVAIGDTMRLRLEEKGAPAERLRVIPNWIDTHAATTARQATTTGRASWGLDQQFVVMHSGNVGHAQDLDSLVRGRRRSCAISTTCGS